MSREPVAFSCPPTSDPGEAPRPGVLYRISIVVWIVVAGALQPVAGETLRYDFEIADHEEAVFEIPFDVIHPGRVGAQISWVGPRILSFRLEGPGMPPVRQVRSGPSPQRMQATATESAIAAGREWKISIRALPARGAATASLVVETPELEPAPEEPHRAATPPTVSPPPMESWARPAAAPPTASAAKRRMFEAVEAFRSIVVLASGELRPDACSWQASFLQYSVKNRDGGGDLTSSTQAVAHTCAGRFTDAVRKIEWLRSTDDPEVRGRAPEDPDDRIAWKARRDEKIRPLEQDIDQIFAMLRADRCPDLAGEIWPSRLLACATGCERHFEEKSRLGDDASAYDDVARDEWPVVLAAMAVLDAITGRAATTESTHAP